MDDEMDDEMDDDEMDDEMMDDEFEETEEEKPQMTKRRSRAAEAGGDDDDDDDGGDDGMDFGVPRKNPAQRRREIFSAPGNLGRSLVAACVGSAASMLRSATASDVLFETCAGGADDVVVGAVGADQMRELHDAVAEGRFARPSRVKRRTRTRTRTRMGTSRDRSPGCRCTRTISRRERFVARRWRSPASATDRRRISRRRCGRAPWRTTSTRGSADTARKWWRRSCARETKRRERRAAALEKSKATKGKSPEEWAAGFFHPRGDGKKTEAAEKGTTRKAEEKVFDKTPGKKKAAAAAGEKTPGKGLSVKTKTPAAKGKASAEGGKSPKSPKETKFSPRLTARSARRKRPRARRPGRSERGDRGTVRARGLRWLEYDVVEA